MVNVKNELEKLTEGLELTADQATAMQAIIGEYDRISHVALEQSEWMRKHMLTGDDGKPEGEKPETKEEPEAPSAYSVLEMMYKK